MTRDEFVTYWSVNAGLAVEDLKRLGLIALPCDCGASDCHGWQMQSTLLYQLDSEAFLALPQEYQDEIRAMEER